ncbi:MAG TPA: hypothetical protein VKQ08_04660, partial [Cyclobacteriaceae bacterium]|nr:hypothetical protein [Cyclobacteriaceae bacterium]
IQSITRGQIPFQKEILSRENRINEYIFTGLRTSRGCNLEELNSQFSFDLLAANRQKIRALIGQGFVQLNNHLLLLTQKGKLLADQISSDLFIND